jgi:hypothetical protein
LSRNVPARNSPDDSFHIWSLIATKIFEANYFPGSEIIARLDPGYETSAPSVKTLSLVKRK